MNKLTIKLTGLAVAACLGLSMPGIGVNRSGAAVEAAVNSTYRLAQNVKVYHTAGDAARRVSPTGTYPAGAYQIYKSYDGMVNITRSQGVPGGWINPADNQASAYSADASLGSRLNIDYVHNTIRTISTRYPGRAFGTRRAADCAEYIRQRISNYDYYQIEKQVSQAVNPLLGTKLVPVINVAARAKNYDPKKKDVLFVAHYDTVLDTPGANDNASGVAMLIEIARYFSNHKADFNPVFLAVGGEEKGKPGTQDYISRYKGRLLTATETIINLDMVGRGSNYQLWNLNEAMQQTFYPKLALKIGQDLGLRIEFKRNSRGIADYKLFEQSGIPTVTFMNITDRYGRNVPYYHTSRDSIGTISKTTLRHVAAMVMNLIESINLKY